MNIINFKCKKCGSNKYKIIEKTTSTSIMKGLYCADCGYYHKWLGKKDEVVGVNATNIFGSIRQPSDARENEIVKRTAQEIADMIRAESCVPKTSTLEKLLLRAVAERIEKTYGLEVRE